MCHLRIVVLWENHFSPLTLSYQGINYISQCHSLTHWGRATHICVSKLTIIASNNGLSPGQAIIWNNAGILSIGFLGTNFSEILIESLTYSFKKMRVKASSAKWRPSFLGLNVLSGLYSRMYDHASSLALPRSMWHALLKQSIKMAEHRPERFTRSSLREVKGNQSIVCDSKSLSASDKKDFDETKHYLIPRTHVRVRLF